MDSGMVMDGMQKHWAVCHCQRAFRLGV